MEATIDRFKKLTHLRTDRELGQLFELTPSNYVSKRNNGSLRKLLIDYALEHDLDLNYILRGLPAGLGANLPEHAQDKLAAALDLFAGIDAELSPDETLLLTAYRQGSQHDKLILLARAAGALGELPDAPNSGKS